jgi:asparagine synthase (glutamine-hydrolysing)
MSAFAVAYNLDGQPLDPDLLQRMIDRVAHRGRDRIAIWCDGRSGAHPVVALGHAMTCTTPESIGETQPLRDETAGLALAFDGRVDNRQELSLQLKGKGHRLRDDSDAEIVLRAFECWGEDSPARILGDFAYAIWDARRNRLFCARDIMGIRPFYYFNDGRTFLAGSELHQLFASHRVPRDPNEQVIAEFLAGTVCDREQTLYRSVLRLPPAHSMTITSDQTVKRRYYDLRDAKQVRFGSDKNFAIHYRDLLTKAIECRMRSSAPLAFELSGGLDSSTVLALANKLMGHDPSRTDRLNAYSLGFAEPESDEKSYQDAVAAKLELEVTRLDAGPTDAAECRAQSARYLDVPDFPNGQMMYPIKAMARERGCRVMLTGDGGDHWLSGSNLYAADLVRRLRLLSAWRRLRSDQRMLAAMAPVIKPSSMWQMMMQQMIRPLAMRALPMSVKDAIRNAIGANPVPDFIDPQLAQRVNLSERLRAEPSIRRDLSCAQQAIYDRFESNWETYTYELCDRSAAWFGLEARHPFHDRRLIEFAFGLPEEQRRREGLSKIVLRNAIKGLVPESIRNRRSKAEFSPHFLKAFEAIEGSAMLANLSIAKLGWLDVEKLTSIYIQMLERYHRGDRAYAGQMWLLWPVFAIEFWFNAISGSAAATRSMPIEAPHAIRA